MSSYRPIGAATTRHDTSPLKQRFAIVAVACTRKQMQAPKIIEKPIVSTATKQPQCVVVSDNAVIMSCFGRTVRRIALRRHGSPLACAQQQRSHIAQIRSRSAALIRRLTTTHRDDQQSISAVVNNCTGVTLPSQHQRFRNDAPFIDQRSKIRRTRRRRRNMLISRFDVFKNPTHITFACKLFLQMSSVADNDISASSAATATRPGPPRPGPARPGPVRPVVSFDNNNGDAADDDRGDKATKQAAKPQSTASTTTSSAAAAPRRVGPSFDDLTRAPPSNDNDDDTAGVGSKRKSTDHETQPPPPKKDVKMDKAYSG